MKNFAHYLRTEIADLEAELRASMTFRRIEEARRLLALYETDDAEPAPAASATADRADDEAADDDAQQDEPSAPPATADKDPPQEPAATATDAIPDPPAAEHPDPKEVLPQDTGADLEGTHPGLAPGEPADTAEGAAQNPVVAGAEPPSESTEDGTDEADTRSAGAPGTGSDRDSGENPPSMSRWRW